ncbi:MAG: trehalose/maltose transport system permease protein [Microbacteriaceae bacterium]|nr:trehalose/maltose transport system permease protein [Microbacteriaceae bacterium]
MTAVAGPAVAEAERSALQRRALPVRRRRRRGPALRTGIQAVLVTIWCLLPAFWMLVGALRDPAYTFETTPWPTHVTLDNFVEAFDPADLLLRGLVNSLGIAVVVTVVALLIGATAGYAVARWQFPGKSVVLGAAIAVSMLPGASLVTPLYSIWSAPGWSYSYASLVIPYIALALPFALYTLGEFFRNLPWELEDAARVDGCSRLQAFRTVLVPLAAPALITTGMLTFIASWNEYVLASVLTNDRTATITVVIANFAAELTGYPVTMAAGVVATAPTILLVLLFQRRIANGLTTGSVKG